MFIHNVVSRYACVLGCIVALLWPADTFSAKVKANNPFEKHITAFQRVQRTAFAQVRKKKGLKPFPKQLNKAWLALLWALRRHQGKLSNKQLKKLRHFLGVQSDVDRNRFHNFPETLTNKIIHSIIQINRRLLASRSSHGHKHTSKLLPLQRSPSSPSMALGDEGSLVKWLPKQKKSSPKDKKSLPPLVFTQKDLERFRGPTRFLSWPIKGGRVSSGFGWRRDPFTKRLRLHKGIDLRATFGTPVYAAAPGRVVRTGWLGSCGLAILLRHVNGFSTYYCHLSQVLAPRNTYIKRGQLIGKIGSTGRSTAPHLHFSLLHYRRAVDPMLYLPAN